MQANNSGRSSLVGDLRRDQIVAAAVRVLARDGLSQTSLNRVAAEAGLSSAGLITYHFSDKDALLATVVERLLGTCAEAVRAAVDAAPDPPAALAAYIEAMIRFQDEHRDGVRALWRLASGWKPAGATDALDTKVLCGPVEEILHRGQATGDFAALHTAWVARCINSSVESFHQVLCDEPDLDTDAFIAELQTLYGNAVRGDGRP